MADEVDKQIGANCKLLRNQAGLTQRDVADHLGIPYQSYQRMEGGKHSFRTSTAIKLANLFRVSTQDILGLNGVPSVGATVAEVRIVTLLAQMTAEQREAVFRAAMIIKNGAPSD